MERMKLTDLSAKSSYIVYLTATLNRNTKETLKYEPLRIYPERVCTFYQDETEGGHHRALYNNETDRTNNFYDFNQLKWRMSQGAMRGAKDTIADADDDSYFDVSFL